MNEQSYRAIVCEPGTDLASFQMFHDFKKHIMSVQNDESPRYRPIGLHYDDRHGEIARKTVKESKLSTHRNNPQKVKVKIFRLFFENGVPTEKLVSTLHDVPLPIRKMTHEEQWQRQQEILANVNENLHDKLIEKASLIADSSTSEGFLEELEALADLFVPS